MDKARIKQVRDELKAAGVSSLGLLTPESKGLAKVLHPDEHIGGVVYGSYPGGLAWLIATDQRVVFMDKKPFFMTTDELTYDVVSGVQSIRAGLFTSVILHTRINNYSMRFVNTKCAQIFVSYIEKRRLESGAYNQNSNLYTPTDQQQPLAIQTVDVDSEALRFLKEHSLAVLSTVDRTGNVNGAVVYYLMDQDNLIYILTKSGTSKGRNVYAHSQVALTMHEPGTMQTAQLQGIAEVETDQKTKDSVFAQIVALRPYRDSIELPPVTKLHEGAFMVIKITPTVVSFHDYAKSE